jgi:hypothetical protein
VEVFRREALNVYMQTWAEMPHAKKLLIALVLLSGCTTQAPDLSRETSIGITELLKHDLKHP